eukprot:6184541-Pleurochrysis_carterae.AAC.1
MSPCAALYCVRHSSGHACDEAQCVPCQCETLYSQRSTVALVLLALPTHLPTHLPRISHASPTHLPTHLPRIFREVAVRLSSLVLPRRPRQQVGRGRVRSLCRRVCAPPTHASRDTRAALRPCSYVARALEPARARSAASEALNASTGICSPRDLGPISTHECAILRK